jgi:ankyrin repeat protein
MNIPDKDGMTPLIGVLSSSMRPGLIAKILIEHGADVNAHNPQGLTALHMATNGRFTCVKSLLEHGANPNDTTQGGATPLYLACCEGCLPIVDILLRYNANKNIACNDGSTPLQMARRKGNPAIIRLLTTGQREMPQYDTQGRTALSRACKEGKIDEIQKLIAQGANVNAANEDINETPLMLACHESRADIIRLLVKNGADVNLAGRDFSPLMVACRYATPEIVDFLIEEGADPHWESSDRHANALHWACMQGDLYTIRRFVEDFHISVTTKTRCIKSGNVVNKTPLEIAQDFNHQDVVDFLSGIVRILTFTAQCLHNS